MAVVLNLLPVPPLDGYGIIRPFLPRDLQVRIDGAAQFGFYIVFAALWFVPQANIFFFGIVRLIGALFGLPEGLAGQGYQLFRFWD